MKIAYTDIYGSTYMHDACFDPSSCKFGENLLIPGIRLKRKFEEMGHEYHTIDMYDITDIDFVIFQDIPRSIYTIESWKDPIHFIRNPKNDWLYQVIKHVPKENRALIIMESPIISERSYKQKYHRYFKKIFTWDDDLVKKYGYRKYCYPQVKPDKLYKINFTNKKFLTMICGNKTNNSENQLYSERRKVIDFYESYPGRFDLYGFGWEKDFLKNYKGTTDHKLDILSQYKFCICYENCNNIKGYITEKIFDCFFANCIPIYWGAENIEEYVPEGCYIDRRKFFSIDELDKYLKKISYKTYQKYIYNIQKFLESEKFDKLFSVDAYVDTLYSGLFD